MKWVLMACGIALVFLAGVTGGRMWKERPSSAPAPQRGTAEGVGTPVSLEDRITDSWDAARVLVWAPELHNRARLERLVTDSYDASLVLAEAPIVLDRAALEARVTESRDVERVLRRAPEFANRPALVLRITQSADAAALILEGKVR